MKLLALIVLSAVSTSLAFAQSPREQLQQLTAQLQKNPDDKAIREQIIRLATQLKPLPALPDEALRREGRARAAFQTARSESEYLDAAKEYQAALLQAPWVAGYYSDLCTIYEKAGVYAEAKRSCQWALTAEREPAAGAELKRRIAGVDFLLEKFSKEGLATRLERPFRADVSGLPAGNRWFCDASYEVDSTRYENTGSNPVAGREEYWFMSDGATARVAFVLWPEAESLASFARKTGKATNPFVRVFPVNRSPAAPRRFYQDGIYTHNVYDVSADGQTVDMVRRKGASPAEAREDMQRWRCVKI